MLIEKITQDEMDAISAYRRKYAFSHGAVRDGHFTTNENLLREWEDRKGEYLFRLFGEQLILRKEVTYNKSQAELMSEMSDIMNSCYGRVGRSGAEFYNAIIEFSLQHPALNENERQNIYNFFNMRTLVENRFDGISFEIPNPKGKPLKFAHGCKVTKALGKLAEAYDLPGFEDFRICHSQILNQKTLTGTFCLSIHPLDYMTMSDNKSGWDSCMSWNREGGYRQGTVEMLNSSCVVVAYLASDMDMSIECGHQSFMSWNNKKWRELMIVHKDMIASIKGYPYDNSDLTNEAISWLRELARENCNWEYQDVQDLVYENNSPLTYNGSELRVCFETDYMYNDFGAVTHSIALSTDMDIEENYHVRKNYCGQQVYHLIYSGRNQCMVCGDQNVELDDESCLACLSCQWQARCNECGDMCGDDYYEVDGNIYCDHCYSHYVRNCAVTDHEHHINDMWGIYIIPRMTREQQMEYAKMNEYRGELGSDEDYILQPPSRTKIYLSDYVEPDEFVQRYLKTGRIEKRRWRYDVMNYVYFDQLTDEALSEFGLSNYKDNEDFLRNKAAHYSLVRTYLYREV